MRHSISISLCQFLWVLSRFVSADFTHLIESPKITDWGTWGDIDRCPPGTFATGMQLKVEAGAGWKDDTGLNGIKFFCSELRDDSSSEETSTEIITSSVGAYGGWGRAFSCGEGDKMSKKMSAVVGFQLRSEPPKGSLDDTSANNLRIICADFSVETNVFSTVIEGDGTGWGSWTGSQFCRQGYAVCGIVTQIDHGRGKGYDDTSLNNLKAECCKIQFLADEDKKATSSVSLPNPGEIAVVNDVTEKVRLPPNETLPIVEVPTKEQSSSPPSEIDLGLATDEITRVAGLDFGKPEITVTIKIPTIEDEERFFEVPLGTDMPHEVTKFIQSTVNDDDPDPSQVNMITGQIRSGAIGNEDDKYDISANNRSSLTEAVTAISHKSEVTLNPTHNSAVGFSCISMPVLCLWLLFIRPTIFTITL